jgi:hypothetical protein
MQHNDSVSSLLGGRVPVRRCDVPAASKENALVNLTLPQGVAPVQGRRVILNMPFRPARNIAFIVVCPYSGRRWLDRRILIYVAMGS